MTRRKKDFSFVVAIPAIILIAAAAFGIRFLIAGQDLGCVFAEDPAPCAAVKGVGE